MTLTAHALVGAALAASFSNPAIGIPLAVISHPILDMIPHWDFGRGCCNILGYSNSTLFNVELEIPSF